METIECVRDEVYMNMCVSELLDVVCDHSFPPHFMSGEIPHIAHLASYQASF